MHAVVGKRTTPTMWKVGLWDLWRIVGNELMAVGFGVAGSWWGWIHYGGGLVGSHRQWDVWKWALIALRRKENLKDKGWTSHKAIRGQSIMKLPLHCGSQNIKYRAKLTIIITVRQHKEETKAKKSRVRGCLIRTENVQNPSANQRPKIFILTLTSVV